MKYVKRIFWFIFIINIFCYSQSIGLPRFNPESQIVKHRGYTLKYNELHEQAEWVAYKLTAQEVFANMERTDDFRKDPKVETGSATLADYKYSGFDRGHLVPAADMEWSNTAMSHSFYLSNMSPQRAGFNRGIWKKLESLVRTWAVDNREVYVVTAGILEPNLKTIGANKVSVPDYFYKVILDYERPERKAIGFILPNRKSSNIKSYAVTIDKVEQRTGIDFFHSLPDNIEDKLEGKVDINKWSFESYREAKSKSSKVTFPINVNTASRSELKALPGIGTVLSGRIINYRRTHHINSVKELDNIKGIGPKTVDKLRGKVSF